MADFNPQSFRAAFERFQKLVLSYTGSPFTNLHEGLVGGWERYKPLLRELALTKLNVATWDQATVGRGQILRMTIGAIEIQDNRPGGLKNNFLFWQNRFGHSSREHRALLDAQQDANARQAIEATLFDLFRTNADEGTVFERLSELTGRKYTLSAYLFFLKDINRFMPIQPTGFDRAFYQLGIDFTTLRNCSWENYRRFNDILGQIRLALEDEAGLKNVRLVDAHSFIWAFTTLLKRLPAGTETTTPKGRGEGRILGGRERSITTMRLNILNTVNQSRGQIVTRNVQMKVKDLGFDNDQALDAYLSARMKIQGDRCALTGIPFHFHGDPEADRFLLPSPDRIDSNGHYAPGNIQVVCQFANFWKRDMKHEEFMRLLTLVRNEEAVKSEMHDAPE
ncbi:MAG: hypothetical protein JO056_06090 [Alphaproteobacteria bacterium]|uniref:hypothetical protein n=1 Tax=Bradyrhizobium sp. TaxID=376 RepID=UPI001EB0C76F|nr:hypothetical protein [Bradyrhizobium sp.]MBV9570792.1 hypothetical protein [Alphaproteobacteria bacterium]MBV9979043.1 hypothetical protein [Bradyrhizobium sp.]